MPGPNKPPTGQALWLHSIPLLTYHISQPSSAPHISSAPARDANLVTSLSTGRCLALLRASLLSVAFPGFPWPPPSALPGLGTTECSIARDHTALGPYNTTTTLFPPPLFLSPLSADHSPFAPSGRLAGEGGRRDDGGHHIHQTPHPKHVLSTSCPSP